MKALSFCLISCLALSCHKDAAVSNDNYIQIGAATYIREINGKYQSDYYPPYYAGVTWSDGNDNSGIEVTVGNTCENMRGALSDFRGFVQFKIQKGQDILQYYGRSELFNVENKDGKRYILFDQYKVYRFEQSILYLNPADYKLVSGRVTFK